MAKIVIIPLVGSKKRLNTLISRLWKLQFLNSHKDNNMSTDLENMSFTEMYKKLTKRWLSPDDLEEEYGFSKSTQAKMRMASSSSNIPFSKVGKYVRYDRVAINTWLEEHSVQGV